MRLISGCLHSTQVSWLPLLANAATRSLRRKSATYKMLQITEAHPDWLFVTDVCEHPPVRLASQRPIHSDMTPVVMTAQ